MKKILLSFFAASLMSAGAVSAATTYQSVSINRYDGTTMVVKLEDDAETSIKDGVLVFSCSKGNIALSVADVRSWTFSTQPGSDDLWSGIESVDADAVAVAHVGDRLVFRNVASGSVITLVSVDGRVLHRGNVSGEEYVMSLAGLPQGIYVATYGNNSLKIAVR